MTEAALVEAHVRLSSTLRDTHYGHHLRVVQQPPSPIDFAKAVGNGIPFLLKGVAKRWPAVNPGHPRRWTNDYLASKLTVESVTVSVTGDGYADAVRWLATGSDSQSNTTHCDKNGSSAYGPGEFVFATPYEKQMRFANVLKHLLNAKIGRHTADSVQRPIAFCQLQNDCLRGPQYQVLLDDVPEVIPSWASAVLGAEPEAVNFWMGGNESVTTMHSDPFDNIYTVIRGRKIFTLYPPCDVFFFSKQEYPTAVWRACSSNKDTSDVVPSVELVLTSEDGILAGEGIPLRVPWIPITHPCDPAPLYPRFASAPRPFVAVVEVGDQLFLPRGWLHHVEQEDDDDGVCIAVNAWYEGWEGMGLSWGWAEYAKQMESIFSCQPPQVRE